MNPIIFALDVPKYTTETSKLVHDLSPHIGVVKVGLELFISEGPKFLEDIPLPIFLDLKLHDIPDTVERAIRAAGKHKVKFLTMHISQEETVVRAVAAAKDVGITLLGVTVLTSMNNKDMQNAGSVNFVSDQVNYLFATASDWGLNGFVMSGKEVAWARQYAEPDTILVVPGVRSGGAAIGSQKRVVTPKEAMNAGADYIVVGRQIRDAAHPVDEAKRILEEIG